MKLAHIFQTTVFSVLLLFVMGCGLPSKSNNLNLNEAEDLETGYNLTDIDTVADSVIVQEEKIDLPPNPDKDLYLPKEISPLSGSTHRDSGNKEMLK